MAQEEETNYIQCLFALTRLPRWQKDNEKINIIVRHLRRTAFSAFLSLPTPHLKIMFGFVFCFFFWVFFLFFFVWNMLKKS